MPSNCCVPNCVANAASYINLRFYRFPSDPKRRSVWKRLVRNEDLSVHPYICCLHFEGSVKTYDVDTPTIFPWTREWSEVLREYNQRCRVWFEQQTINNHDYAKPPKGMQFTPMKHVGHQTKKRRSATSSRSISTVKARMHI